MRNRRRHLDWSIRDRERARQAHERGELPPETPLPDFRPATVTHFAYLTGWKARQEFTACGKKAKGLQRAEDLAIVNCSRCLAVKYPREQPVRPTVEPDDVDQIVR